MGVSGATIGIDSADSGRLFRYQRRTRVFAIMWPGARRKSSKATKRAAAHGLGGKLPAEAIHRLDNRNLVSSHSLTRKYFE